MKGQLFSVIFAAPILLCSCGVGKSSQNTLPQSFSLRAQISDCDFAAEAMMTRQEGGWEIEFIQPENIEGLELTLTDVDCTVRYEELSYTATIEQLPENSAVRLTAQALDKCVGKKPQGVINGVEYSVSFEDGKPQRLTVGGEIEVNFYDYEAEK